MSIGDLALALNSTGDPGADFTLKASYVPRASSVGVTPEGGDASGTATKATSASAAVAATMNILRFIATPFSTRPPGQPGSGRAPPAERRARRPDPRERRR